ncbi:MAG: hypothetical protein KGI08_02555 [Thaumarchaeota archaeon]|nr:hypothetical protein [Nitrososphaerota archaeon]
MPFDTRSNQQKAKDAIDGYMARRQEKDTWMIHYQVIAEYFLTRKADFTINFVPGMFLNRDLYDATGVLAGNIAASALLGMLWPSEGRNFEFRRPKNIPDTKENRDYYVEISHRLNKSMNHIECGLNMTLDEYMRDEVFFGTCGVGVFEPFESHVSPDAHFLFQAWDIKRMVIDEGPNGFVNRIYYEREETIENCVKEFGQENLSIKVQDLIKSNSILNMMQKIRILHVIEPRYSRNPEGESVYDMPVSSCYYELDEQHLIKESGYPRMPVFVGRLLKNIRERYGRSFAMDALPDVLELNAIREMEIVATEKLLDPPLGVLDDGRLGANVLDTSAGAISVFNISGRIGNQPPVFPLQTIGDMKPTKDRIEELKQSVSDHFMIDRLLDFNNETEMTAFEVNEREKLRSYVLNSVYARQETEVFAPLIHCCFQMELDRDHLGVLPYSEKHIGAVLNGEPILVIPPDIATAMLRGEDVYDLVFLTPASRMRKAQLAQGIITSWKFLNDVAQAQPEIYDVIDEDMSAKLIVEYSGAPDKIIRSDEVIKQIRNARDQQQQQDKKFQQQVEMMKAAGHLKGLAPQQGAPGVQSQMMEQPLQVG